MWQGVRCGVVIWDGVGCWRRLLLLMMMVLLLLLGNLVLELLLLLLCSRHLLLLLALGPRCGTWCAKVQVDAEIGASRGEGTECALQFRHSEAFVGD